MLGGIVLILVVLIAALLAYAATRPGSLHVERSTIVIARPDKVFPLINDFRNWSGWSPYEKRDPAMKKVFSGAPNGKGAVYEWDGNKELGKGRMEMIDAQPSRIAIKLDFVRPFEGHNVATFTLESEPAGAKVTWAMDGPASFMMKVMCIFINMDNMIGRDFAAGLANLKAIAEK